MRVSSKIHIERKCEIVIPNGNIAIYRRIVVKALKKRVFLNYNLLYCLLKMSYRCAILLCGDFVRDAHLILYER